MSQRVGSGTGKKRGHQHHPRSGGTRGTIGKRQIPEPNTSCMNFCSPDLTTKTKYSEIEVNEYTSSGVTSNKEKSNIESSYVTSKSLTSDLEKSNDLTYKKVKSTDLLSGKETSNFGVLTDITSKHATKEETTNFEKSSNLTLNNVALSFEKSSDLTPKKVILLENTSSDVTSKHRVDETSTVIESASVIVDLTDCDNDEDGGSIKNRPRCQKSLVIKDNLKSIKDEINKKLRKNTEDIDMSLVYRPAAEGSSQSDQEGDEDSETEELARLRCTSERTEVIAERETRRKRRCADYPGLAFGSSIFSSDTLMKFSIIRNELYNIMNTQLKRVGF